jgi:hypothetical protein
MAKLAAQIPTKNASIAEIITMWQCSLYSESELFGKRSQSRLIPRPDKESTAGRVGPRGESHRSSHGSASPVTLHNHRAAGELTHFRDFGSKATPRQDRATEGQLSGGLGRTQGCNQAVEFLQNGTET